MSDSLEVNYTHTWFLKSVDSGDWTSVLRLSRLACYQLSYFPSACVTYLIYLEAHIEPGQNKDTLNDELKEKYWYLYFRLWWVGNGVFTSNNMSRGQVEPYETLSWYGPTCHNYTWWRGSRGQPWGYTHCWQTEASWLSMQHTLWWGPHCHRKKKVRTAIQG